MQAECALKNVMLTHEQWACGKS